MIPFNKPHMTGRELSHIAQAHFEGVLAGDGRFTKECQDDLQRRTGSRKVLLTHSCTAALEMAALLLDFKPGDEVIMPSYTFVSTANAFVLRGAVPVFVDIRADTLNMDERLIEDAITPRTKAIVPVHYAGVACEMDTINEVAAAHGLSVVEDAAQGVLSSYCGRPLGSLGQLGAFSFHETKNIISGEGGALLINDPVLISDAEVIWQKGTNRQQFHRGEVDKYTWQRPGSSFLPGEIVAAFLKAQLEEAEAITANRLAAWDRYHQRLQSLAREGLVGLPTIPGRCVHNAHMYYVILPEQVDRDRLLADLRRDGIHCLFHYVPLHSAPGGKVGRAHGSMTHTDSLSSRLIRLPLWWGISEREQDCVTDRLTHHLRAQLTCGAANA
ncbi:dTDP-4-amino-4,6-dideoxygalactose transaminase [Aquabacterium sp.]|uniref:dTDP-4-amino-4,6-dideoxygalactose transaminase n=1 Tax=Aquabacterium sp. TaxID=1872578 RepID=UPI0027B9F153|nr:dTDP-4-amino-4,6-dideoxygalactose transaminase [Aquabacterium sp.]